MRRVASGQNPTQAARDVGYNHPSEQASRLIRHPGIVKALRQKRQALLDGELTHIAFDTLRELMTDRENVPASTRYKASELTLKMGRWIGQENPEDRQKDLSEMNADELSQAITSGMQALSDLAGQMQGHHIVDGQARQIQDVEQITLDDQETADFLD